tara:strand:+ start:289 stop:573 length:285 start_codon:yes stop_codon:yes gene_type:complete
MNNPQEEYNRLHDHMSAIARERDWLQSENGRLTDELNLAHEAMRRAFPENQQLESDKWRGLATMMSHFDICTSARIECNICAEARLAYVEALSQ